MIFQTKDHDTIRMVMTEHGGMPVSYPTEDGEELIGLALGEFLPENYQMLSWEEFFAHFDDSGLLFQYEDGEEEFAYNLVSPENLSENEHEDETELPEENPVAEENSYQQLREEDMR